MRFPVLALAAPLLTAGIALPATAADTASAATQAAYGKQKVIYHINEEAGWSGGNYHGALQNIQNHINAVGADNMEILVVMHGPGVNMMQEALDDAQLRSDIDRLRQQNVKFELCHNTLVAKKLDPAKDLYKVSPEDIVPSGVAEISRRQQQGFTYIKP